MIDEKLAGSIGPIAFALVITCKGWREHNEKCDINQKKVFPLPTCKIIACL